MGNEVYFHSSLGLVREITRTGEYLLVEVVAPGLHAEEFLLEAPLGYEAHGVDEERVSEVRLVNHTEVHISELISWDELLISGVEGPDGLFIPRETMGEPGEAEPRVTDIYTILRLLGEERLYALCQGQESGEVRIFPVWDLINVQTGEGLSVIRIVSDELTIREKVLKRLVSSGAEHWRRPWKSLKSLGLRAVAEVKVYPKLHGLVLLEGSDGSLQEIPWVYNTPREIELQLQAEEVAAEVVAAIKRFLDYIIQGRRNILRFALRQALDI